VSIRAALAGVTVAAVAWLMAAATTLAATPIPSAAAGGDPRSAGQGPGLVGDPAFAILAVIAIGLGAVVATTAYLRLTARRGA
jgi:hypothetical protein